MNEMNKNIEKYIKKASLEFFDTKICKISSLKIVPLKLYPYDFVTGVKMSRNLTKFCKKKWNDTFECQIKGLTCSQNLRNLRSPWAFFLSEIYLLKIELSSQVSKRFYQFKDCIRVLSDAKRKLDNKNLTIQKLRTFAQNYCFK